MLQNPNSSSFKHTNSSLCPLCKTYVPRKIESLTQISATIHPLMEKSSNGEGVFYGRKLEMKKANISHIQDSHIQEKFNEANRSTEQEKTVKDLIFKNGQSNARKLELQSIRNSTKEAEDFQYAELTQQLEALKQELSKLKIDALSALESKVEAEKNIEACNQKKSSSLKRVEELRKEIEEANEEHVLVELARIEAEKELREIESHRAAEATEFSKRMEADKKRISELRREIGSAEEIEEKLVSTNTDVRVLQNEMELLRAMKNNFSEKSRDEEQLKIVENELRKSKKELESIKEEGFQFMASMDLARVELLKASKETNRMKKMEKIAESTIERLNSKLLKARSKLESEALEVERTNGIVSNLSTALDQLRSEVETAEEEKEKAGREMSGIKEAIEKTEMDIKYTEKKLLDSISELETVKASEASALVKLKSRVEKMVKSRAMDSQNSSMICISKWEYEYLRKKAGLAKEVADKKVEAINAWIETLKAQEKEMLLKSEVIEKEIKAMRVAEGGEEVCNVEKVMAAQSTMGEEAKEFMDILETGMCSPRKLISENSIGESRRWFKTRRVSAMQGMKSSSRSPSFTIKKRKREMPTSAMLLRRRNGRMNQNEVDFENENDHIP